MFTSSAQLNPVRNSAFLLDRCVDTVIGFEFLQKILESDRSHCNTVYVTECHPVQVAEPLELKSVQFLATDDPCLKDWKVDKVLTPHIEMQSDDDGKITGVLVRFFSEETCCYPLQMTFRLYGYDLTGCRSSLVNGLILFK